jgi:hypothetical protein
MLSTCTFFGDTICLLTNRKIIKMVTLIDWFTYCIDIWLLLFSLQYLSESCFGNDNKFLLPNPGVVLFFIYPTFYSLCLPNPFLFGAIETGLTWDSNFKLTKAHSSLFLVSHQRKWRVRLWVLHCTNFSLFYVHV